VVNIFTKDDGLGETIGGTEEFRDFGGYQFGTFLQNEIPVIVPVVVLTILNKMTILVPLPHTAARYGLN
jgi:hypothetical protein